jgi:hypothetical protein
VWEFKLIPIPFFKALFIDLTGEIVIASNDIGKKPRNFPSLSYWSETFQSYGCIHLTNNLYTVLILTFQKEIHVICHTGLLSDRHTSDTGKWCIDNLLMNSPKVVLDHR